MIHFFNLIRWKNLIMIALVQYLVKYALLIPFKESHGVTTTLNNLEFLFLVLATVFIAAGGYVINDIFDIKADKVNKPDRVIMNNYISEKNAFTVFVILNIIGVGLGFYLSQSIGKSSFFVIFVIASALLYIYSSALKQMLLIGNIIVSLVVSLSIMIVGIFELLPAVTEVNRFAQSTFLDIIRDYAVFAFIINVIREIIKDIEDIDGDYNAGMQTLPIVLGRERANKIVFILSLIPIITVVYYVITYLFKQQLVVGYFLVLVVAPLIYASMKIYNAEFKSDYKHVSFILKLVMLTGMLSLLLYKYILL